MKIERHRLISELTAFARAGSGVVVGSPGIGKSYALAELREALKRDNVPHLILPVERLGAASEIEIRAVLGKDGDFVNLLQAAVANSETHAVLIFDGFDAARGELERAGVFRLIMRAVTELRGQWNTIVSVRSFDAKKSQRLLDLFPAETSAAQPSCRQFLIPPLIDDDLEQAFAQIPGLRDLHAGATEDFRTLVRVPFNLWLVERALRSGAVTTELSRITSDVQLLELYWDRRIRKTSDAKDREFVLAKAAGVMVEDHLLAIRRDRVYVPDVRGSWDGLLSDEILVETTEREARFSFSHNILFDFAVSVYLLDQNPTRLAKFVAEEPARPLFLRPSLLYHFTRLWHFNRTAFWRNFWSVVQESEIHMRQIVRLVLPAVIVNESQTIEDLAPLLEALAAGQEKAVDAIAFLLQALKILKSPKHALWARFMRSLGPHLSPRFAWDTGNVTAEIIRSNSTLSIEAASDFGDVARNLLHWAWTNRHDVQQRAVLERLAGFVAIPLVAKTFATDKQRSHALLSDVLEVVGEADFPVDCIYRLTNEVPLLIPHDPELVGTIYERVFGYKEESRQETNIGGSVLPMISNRRQDYDMCRYCLIKAFPAFLAVNPYRAIESGIRALQAFGLQGHVLRYLQQDKSIQELTATFSLRGTIASYIRDHSSIWDQSSYPDQELQIADNIFGWLASAAERGLVHEIEEFLDIFVHEARIAFFWSRLLTLAAEHPKILAPRLWEIAVAAPLIEEPDALYALGTFLERAFTHLDESQRLRIENTILCFRSPDGEDTEWYENRRNRLIACIPEELLQTENAKILRQSLKDQKKLPANRPPVTFSSSWSRVTEEDILQERGANIGSAESAEIRKLYQPLREWAEQNKEPSRIDDLMSNVVEVRDFLSKPSNADPHVLRAAWTHLASFASDALRATNDASDPRFETLKQIVLNAARQRDPEPDPENDEKWDNAAWSPAPRNEAAQALPWLTHFGADEQALQAVKKLAEDPVPSVRFLLACELWRLLEHMPSDMWAIFDRLAEKETNSVVRQGITVSLWQLIRHDKVHSLTLIQKMLKQDREETDDDQKALPALIYMIVDYAVRMDEPWAKSTITRWQKDAVSCASSVSAVGRRLVAYINSGQNAEELLRARSLLLTHLDAVGQALGTLQKQGTSPSAEETRTWKSLYDVFHEAVMRIYFAADVNPNLRERKERPLDDAQRKKFFLQVLPILEKVLAFGKEKETGMLLAPTAHHFMEFLNGVLRYDPALVLRMAAENVTSSKRFGYSLDSLAMGETVKLVESILADYRDKVQDEASIKNLLEVLDAFVEVGWPEALNLVWRLDEIYR